MSKLQDIDYTSESNRDHLFEKWDSEPKYMLERIIDLQHTEKYHDFVPVKRVWNDEKKDFDNFVIDSDQVEDYYHVFWVQHKVTGKLYRRNQRKRMRSYAWKLESENGSAA